MTASENITYCAITPGQVRAARALLNWTRAKLSAECKIPMRTLHRCESGEGEPQRRTLAAICRALEGAGIEFIAENGGGPGVRLAR